MLAFPSLWFVLLAQAAPAQAPAVTPESLIPAQTFAVARIRSLDALAGIALPFQRIDHPDAEPLDFIEMIAGMSNLEVDLSSIDRAQPLILAVSSSPTNQPAAATVIATSKNATALAADPKWKRSGWTCTVHGDHVVLATEPLQAAAAASPLFAGLDRGDVVLRVDFQELMAQFGEEIRSSARENFLAENSGPDGAEPSAPTMNFFDGLLTFLDSIESLGVSVSGTGERTHVGFELTGLPGSMIVDFPKCDTRPLEALVRSLDPTAPIMLLSAFDSSSWVNTVEAMMELGAAESREPVPDEAREFMQGLKDVYAAMGPCSAGDWRFGRDGLATTYAVRPTDTTKLIDSYLKLFEFPDMPIQLEGPTAETVSGHEVMRYRMKLDAEAMAEIDAEAEDPAGDVAEANAAFLKLFGAEALPFGYTKHEGMLLVGAGREALFASSIERLAAKQTHDAGKELLARLGTLNPGMAIRFDTPAFVEGALELGALLTGEAVPNAKTAREQFKDCAPAWMTCGLDQRTWRLDVDGELARMAKAFESVSELTPGSEASPR